ncbi:hypothetical protein WDV93_24045 [Pantoea ananatis]
MAYVEANPDVASAVVEILGATPLQVEHSLTLEGLSQSRYPIVLMAMPVNASQPQVA